VSMDSIGTPPPSSASAMTSSSCDTSIKTLVSPKDEAEYVELVCESAYDKAAEELDRMPTTLEDCVMYSNRSSGLWTILCDWLRCSGIKLHSNQEVQPHNCNARIMLTPYVQPFSQRARDALFKHSQEPLFTDVLNIVQEYAVPTVEDVYVALRASAQVECSRRADAARVAARRDIERVRVATAELCDSRQKQSYRVVFHFADGRNRRQRGYYIISNLCRTSVLGWTANLRSYGQQKAPDWLPPSARRTMPLEGVVGHPRLRDMLSWRQAPCPAKKDGIRVNLLLSTRRPRMLVCETLLLTVPY
jgi:hypothetical protein